MIEPWFSAGLVALSAIVGGLLPWTRRWSAEGMHRLVALSAGIFLGTVLHMTGDLALGGGTHEHASDAAGEQGHAHGAAAPIDEHAEHEHGGLATAVATGSAAGSESGAPGASVWLGVVVGFVGLAALERLVNDVALRERLGARARADVLERDLTWRGNARRVIEVATELVAERRRNRRK